MASSSSLDGFLHRWSRPRVLVLPSTDVDRIMSKNHVSFADLLKPLGASVSEHVPAVYFRSASKSYPLKHFGVQFVAPVELDAAAVDAAATNAQQAAANAANTDAYLDSVLRASEPPASRYSDGIQDSHDVGGFLRTTTDPTPWFAHYRSEFHETLRYHDTELLDHPLALLVAVSTADANPLNLIEQLRAVRNLPSQFQRGIYDAPTNLLRVIVVLHDKQTELTDPDARERGANVFRLIKKQYGSEVLRLLEVNSLPPHQPNLKQKDLWKADTERTRWQARHARAMRRPENTNDGINAPSAVAAASPTFLGQTLLSPQAPHSHPPAIHTDGLSHDSPQPMTPSSQSIASATSAVASSALAEMGADEAATVEQEQAEIIARQAAEQQQPPSALSPPSASSSSSTVAALPAFLDPLPAGHARGQFLSPQDLVQTSAFIADFLIKSLLPHLERKVGILGEKVAAVRKGFKNSLKAFFGTRDKSKKPSFNARIGTYEWNTIESQARQLADLAFVVQDYELAVSTYRVCAGDYKQDKLARHFASSQEMLGLSLALGDTSGVINQSTVREMAAALEAAATTFASVGDVRRSTRAAWFFSDCIRWVTGQTRVNECSAVLLRASEKEQSVRAALCMEQAAYLFLSHLPTPLVRKYSFHLVMSGHLYHKYHQKLLGVRAYSASSSVYDHRAWFSVNDHLNYYLGKEYFHLGQFAQSMRHFISLIGEAQIVSGVKPKQTQEKQQTFLREFVFVVQRWQEAEAALPIEQRKSQLVPGLKLPTVIDDSVTVRTNDAHTVPSCYTIQAWNLALRVNPLMTSDKAQCNRPLVTPGWHCYRESDRGCVVGETVHIEFQVSNPLLIELQCSHMRLKCKWRQDATETTEEMESRVGVAVGEVITPDAVFTYSTLSLTLAPMQTVSVSLAVTPLKQGTLCVEGMLWDVMDVLKGFHPFALPMRQVTFPVVGGRRRKPELQPDPSLIIPITSPSPLLAVEVADFPSHLHQGEVVRLTVRLANRGTVGLHKICLRLSHPSFVVIAPPNDVGGDAAADAPCYTHTWNEGYIQLPLTLQPGSVIDLPLYLRGTHEGQHTLGLLWKYEPLVSTGGLKHRLAYRTFTLFVTPLFNMKVFTRPSFQHIKDSLIGVELQDRQQTIPGLVGTQEYADLARMAVHTIDVHLAQVSVLSKMWTIAPLQRNGAATHEEHHNALHAPRKIHSSVSSPVVSSLMHETNFALPVVHALPPAASQIGADAIVPTAAGGPLPPATHILRPYESMVQFFRVTNLPGSFGAPSASGSGAHTEKTLHTSASANNLSRESSHAGPAARPPHHSHVPLSAARGPALIIDPAHPAVAHLLHMEKQLLVEAEKQTLIVNPAAVLADVGASNRLDVVCCWRNTAGDRSGFYHAPGLASMKSQPSAFSLKVLLRFPRHVSHDFRSQALFGLEVPIGVAIRNTLEDAPLSFAFETLPSEEEFDATKRVFRLHASSSRRGRYTWSGNTKCRVADLAPGEEVTVQLFATFPAPGVYNLNRFRFTVEQAGKKPRVFFFPLQHLIHVQQQDEQANGATADNGEAANIAPSDPITLDVSGMPDSSLLSASGSHHLESVEELDMSESQGSSVPAVAIAEDDDNNQLVATIEETEDEATVTPNQTQDDVEDTEEA